MSATNRTRSPGSKFGTLTTGITLPPGPVMGANPLIDKSLVNRSGNNRNRTWAPTARWPRGQAGGSARHASGTEPRARTEDRPVLNDLIGRLWLLRPRRDCRRLNYATASG